MTPMDLIKAAKHATWKEPYAWPGGYEIRVVLSDGEILCRACVKKNWKKLCFSTLHNRHDGWTIDAVDVMWEGPSSFCPQCNKELPTEYGDPDEREEES